MAAITGRNRGIIITLRSWPTARIIHGKKGAKRAPGRKPMTSAGSAAFDAMGQSPQGVPRDYNFAADVLQRNLDAGRAGKPAYIDVGGTHTYGQLADRVARFGAALRDLGVKREERVLIALLATIDWPTAFLGCLKAGIIAVPVNTLLPEDDYRF